MKTNDDTLGNDGVLRKMTFLTPPPAGLKQLLHESGVYAAVSVQQMMSGKDFDRALRGLRLVDEALNRRFILQFNIWCQEMNHPILSEVSDLLSALTEDVPVAEVMPQLTEVISGRFTTLIQIFREQGRASSPTFQ